ncbi:amidohydrolase family protein [Streptomyces sp. NBC_00513]|uniref:amidohydrolase family protein n=1 Tax=unclassified Streptomyces TaxID=2593676 RepID=UPI00224F5DFF|nr:amidohydrolase family protein [Streptomyces sp. NBC_00424]MCX5071090.1 amidohydrolase family protein [Streptomyces sp. NBC_00424]WUD45486.1 amidohydrolase family protein [Streptomyces sp. NBC_00513]
MNVRPTEPAEQAGPQLTLLTADRVIVGRDSRVIANGAVLVSGASIAWVGERNRAPHMGAGTTEIPLPGCTLMPGLVEGHAHLCLDGGTDPFGTLASSSPGVRDEVVRRAAERMIRAGITSVRDLGCPAGADTVLREAVLAGRFDGPALYSSGVPLTSVGGHCSVMGGAIAGVEDVADLVAANHSGGATWTKVMATGGFLTSPVSSPYLPQLPADILRAAVAASRRLGMRVAAHAHGRAGIEAAFAVGVDSIEHCTWMTEGGFDVDEALVAKLARHGVAVGATVNSKACAATGRLPWHERRRQLRLMRAAGVRLIVSTDCGISGTPHDDLPASLVCYLDAGFTTLQILEAATAGNADALGIGADAGRLAPGLRADVLAVRGNPLEDLDRLRGTMLVMGGGRLIPSPTEHLSAPPGGVFECQ